jgi:hypothetical protein
VKIKTTQRNYEIAKMICAMWFGIVIVVLLFGASMLFDDLIKFFKLQ